MLPLDMIRPNPRQPRQTFDQQSLAALAESIKSSGLMQPIVVRRDAAAGGHQIIAGERRWRAARLAGLTHIPAVVRDLDDRAAAELALVENLQRDDLNPLERAEAFARLINEFALTHAEVAERVGLDRTSITNHLRLNDLDATTKDLVRTGRLSLGHAKVLLGLTNFTVRSALAQQAVREDWSVREIERRIKEASRSNGERPSSEVVAPPTPRSANVADLEKRLGEQLGTKVRIVSGRTKGSGKLVLEFYDLDQFEGLLRRLRVEME